MKPNELADMNRKIWIMKTCSTSIIDDQVGNARMAIRAQSPEFDACTCDKDKLQ